MTDVNSGITLWAQSYDFAPILLSDAQTKVARSVAKQLKTRLSPVEAADLEKHYTHSAVAYELYLRGKGLLFKNTAEDVRLAISMFTQAIDLDEHFVDAIAGKAYGLWKRYFQGWDATEDTLYQALSLGEKAVQMDPSSAMARMSIVRICWDLGWHERALEEGQ